jgi:hypothetical protein
MIHHSGKKFTLSFKTKYIFMIQPSNHTPGHFCKRNENLCPLKNLYIQVFTAALFVMVKPGNNPMSFHWWMAEQPVEYP